MVDIKNDDFTNRALVSFWGHDVAGVGGKTPIGRARNIRNMNKIVGGGDSRVNAIFLDGTKRQKGSGSGLNWALALSGQRMRLGAGFGVSGTRSDEMLATQIPQALATDCGILYMWTGLNDIAQNYPTATTSAATAAANIIAACNMWLDAGGEVILEQEIGATNINATQLAQVMELRQRLREFAAKSPGIHLHDAAPAVLDQDNSATAIAFKTNYAYDATHLNGLGAYYHGKSLKTVIDALSPPAFAGVYNTVEQPANGRWQLLTNPLFTPNSGGTLNAGITGTVPANCSVARSGSATAAVSVAADPDGFGSNVSMDVTWTAADELVRLGQDINIANWSPGDIVECGAVVQVSNPVNLAGVTALLQINGDSLSYDSFDLFPLNGTAAQKYGPDEGYTLTFTTQPFTIPAMTTKGYATLHLRAVGRIAGSVTVKVLRNFIRRRLAE